MNRGRRASLPAPRDGKIAAAFARKRLIENQKTWN
jgi:hypothetical protein